jgi:hypothetical protein
MTLDPKPIQRVIFNASLKASQHEEFFKQITGIVTGEIICSKSAGIQRPKKDEPYEGELLIVKSSYKYTPGQLDLQVLDNNEPGNHRWYLVILPMRAEFRPTGRTSIAKYYLATSPSFDTLESAQEAYARSR